MGHILISSYKVFLQKKKQHVDTIAECILIDGKKMTGNNFVLQLRVKTCLKNRDQT